MLKIHHANRLVAFFTPCLTKSLSVLKMNTNKFDEGADKDLLLEKINLTRKQFYLHIS